MDLDKIKLIGIEKSLQNLESTLQNHLMPKWESQKEGKDEHSLHNHGALCHW